MVEDHPPGFRFYPTEEELVSFYLHNKLERRREDLNQVMDRIIPVVNIYEHNPWDLPKFSQYLCHRDTEQWFFFTPRQESDGQGRRSNRLTTVGYWKASGSPGFVYSSNRPVGEKRTMVFYRGRAPSGTKTEWKMNEYKAIDVEASTISGARSTPVSRPEFSLCRVYKKSKCLRSFDRRPPPGLIINEPMAQLVAHHGDSYLHPQAITTSCHDQNLQMGAVDRTSSPERSSSVEGLICQPPQTEEGTMTSNNKTWWEWDKFQRFCE